MTANTGGYFSPGDDPARVTWFDDEMEALVGIIGRLIEIRYEGTRCQGIGEFVRERGVLS